MTRPRRMRMAELARVSGVPRETIHFYLREGLLPKPTKGGKTVAYYDESHVERLNLIRNLRDDKYLPLAVIRRMLHVDPATRGRDVETLADVLSIDPTLRRDEPTTVTDDESLRVALELGLLGDGVAVAPGTDPTQRRVLAAVAEAIALEGDARRLTLDDLQVCARELSRLVDREAGLFFDLVIRSGDMASSVAALRGGRGSVARFVTSYRDLMLRRVVDDVLEAIQRRDAPAPRILRLGDECARRLGVARKQTALRSRAESGDAAAANDLVWHLFVLAPWGQLARLGRPIRELLRPRALVLVEAAVLALGKDDERRLSAEERLSQLVERASPFALGTVLHCEATLSRLVAHGPRSGSFIDEAVPVLHRLASVRPGEDADPLASSSAYFRRGLVGLGLPRILGRHGHAVRDLEQSVDVLAAVPGRIDGGARARIEGNARLALGRWFRSEGDAIRAARELERARAADPLGPLGRVAGTELEELDRHARAGA